MPKKTSNNYTDLASYVLKVKKLLELFNPFNLMLTESDTEFDQTYSMFFAGSIWY
jgi:hypothetical protein